LRAGPLPENGDVIVRQKERKGKPVFVLSRAPGPDEYFVRSRKDAVAQAIAFANLAGARAWFAAGSVGFLLLASGAYQDAERPVPCRADASAEGA
jgi:hypothetical protein